MRCQLHLLSCAEFSVLRKLMWKTGADFVRNLLKIIFLRIFILTNSDCLLVLIFLDIM
jgi:hypothetical protein